MLTYTGKEAREIYEILPWTEPDDKMKFDKVIKAFREYCQPYKNILYKQRKFWSLKQGNNAYSMRLKVRIDHCDCKRKGWPETVKIEMIRDKFVFGIQDDYLKECLMRK